MSSVTPLTKTKTFNGDISASDEVNAADLDTQIARCYQMGQETIAALDRLTDGADALRNRTVGLLQLKTEVLNALEGLPTPLSGVQTVATTNVALSGLQTLNGYTLVANDRVVLVGQTDQRQNGLWVAAAGAWSRPSDFAAASSPEQYANVEVLAGSQLGAVYALNTVSVTVDTTDQVWIQIQAANNGTTEWLLSSYSTLAAALTSIGATPGTLIIDTTATLTQDTAIPSTLSIRPTRAGSFDIGAWTLTMTGAVIGAAQHQIFDTSGGGSVVFARHTTVLAEWFGAVADGSTDCRAALQAAIDSLTTNGGTVLCSGAEYAVTDTQVTLNGNSVYIGLQHKSNVALVGAGSQVTTLTYNPTTSDRGYLILSAESEHLTLRGFKLDVSAVTTNEGTVRYESAQHLLIEDCWLYQPYTGGLLVSGASFYSVDQTRKTDMVVVRDVLVEDQRYWNPSVSWAGFIFAGGAGGGQRLFAHNVTVLSRNLTYAPDCFDADACDATFIACTAEGGLCFAAEGDLDTGPFRVSWTDCVAIGYASMSSHSGWYVSENVDACIVNPTVRNIDGNAATNSGMWLACRSARVIGGIIEDCAVDTSGLGGGAINYQWSPTEETDPTRGNPVADRTTAGQCIIEGTLFKGNTYNLSNYVAVPTDSFSITAVATGTKQFTIAGDKSIWFPRGGQFAVTGSTGNDGTYTVAAWAVSGGNTVITVEETVASAVADGQIDASQYLRNNVIRMSGCRFEGGAFNLINQSGNGRIAFSGCTFLECDEFTTANAQRLFRVCFDDCDFIDCGAHSGTTITVGVNGVEEFRITGCRIYDRSGSRTLVSSAAGAVESVTIHDSYIHGYSVCRTGATNYLVLFIDCTFTKVTTLPTSWIEGSNYRGQLAISATTWTSLPAPVLARGAHTLLLLGTAAGQAAAAWACVSADTGSVGVVAELAGQAATAGTTNKFQVRWQSAAGIEIYHDDAQTVEWILTPSVTPYV